MTVPPGVTHAPCASPAAAEGLVAHAVWSPARVSAALAEVLVQAPGAPLDPAADAPLQAHLSRLEGDAAGALQAAWGEAVTVVVHSAADPADVSEHLRAFGELRNLDKSPVPMPLHDGARVGAWLETLDPREAAHVFGAQGEGAFLIAAVVAGERVFRPVPDASAPARRGRPGLQLRVKQLEALGIEPSSLPPARVPQPAPALVTPRSLLAELKDGEALLGLPHPVEGGLELEDPSGARHALRGRLRRLTPLSGPVHRTAPLSWPLIPEPVEGAELFARASATGTRVWVLLDAGSMPEAALDALQGTQALTPGRLPPERADAAAYLLPLSPEDPQAESLLAGVAAGWGCVLLTAAPQRPLAAHLRLLLRVTQEQTDKTLSFRFQDPRVLGLWLPTLTGDDAAQLLGAALNVEGERSCPVCDTDLEGRACSWCDAVFTGAAEPVLIEGLAVRAPSGDLVLHRLARATRGAAPRRRARGKTRLIVRDEQLEVLGDDFARREGEPSLTDALLDYAREVFGGRVEALGEERIRAELDELIASAAGFRIWHVDDLTAFVRCAFFLDPTFPGWVQERSQLEVLHDPSASAAERTERLWELAKAHERAAGGS